MLFSIALAPGVLNPPAAHTPSQVRSLAAVLAAVAQNGIIVTPDTDNLRTQLMQTADTLQGPGTQRFKVLATEFAKRIRHYSVNPPSFPRPGERGDTPLRRCLAAADWGGCDAVVVLDESERARCTTSNPRHNRPIPLEEFPGGDFDLWRAQWLTTQRIDKPGNENPLSLVGKAIRYERKLTVADKMIGVSLKPKIGQKDSPFHRAARVQEHLAGLALLVEAWQESSPFARHDKLDVDVMTVAGQSGSRAGVIDPSQLRTAINTALGNLGLSERIKVPTITLKQEGTPQIFNDRLLVCRGRAWGLHHGLDDFGRLGQTTGLRPTLIDPASDARSSVFRDIMALKKA